MITSAGITGHCWDVFSWYFYLLSLELIMLYLYYYIKVNLRDTLFCSNLLTTKSPKRPWEQSSGAFLSHSFSLLIHLAVNTKTHVASQSAKPLQLHTISLCFGSCRLSVLSYFVWTASVTWHAGRVERFGDMALGNQIKELQDVLDF